MNFISQYRLEKRALMTRLAASSHLADTPCGWVEFAESGAGPAVILSHGSLGGYDSGLWLAGLLGEGFHFIAPSRFGYLRTPCPANGSADAQADQFAALLDALQIERAVMVGLSAGGLSALQFALRHPQRCAGLVMLSAISHRLDDMPWFFKALYFGLMKADFLPWLLIHLNPAMVYGMNGVKRPLLDRIASDMEKMGLLRRLADTSMLPALRRDGMMNDLQQATQWETSPLAEIRVPTLVVHAVDDPVVAFEFGQFSAAHIPDARLLAVEGGGHFCCVTHCEQVVPEITGFLQACSTPGG